MNKLIALGVLLMSLAIAGYTINKMIQKRKVEDTYNQYIKYLKAAYDIMQQNYYLEVNPANFEQYVKEFKERIFIPQVKDKTKVDDAIKHVATGILISRLKDPKDSFTTFVPPNIAKQFKDSLLGSAGDVGLEGHVKDGRFVITQVEPRSDAKVKGVQVNDEVVKIDGKPVSEIPEQDVSKLFSLALGKELNLEIFSPIKASTYTVILVSTQYFKQSVFFVPTSNPQVVCLQIRFFNEQTGNEMREAVQSLNSQSVNKLIIDLRNNGGGPPLAAWDISGIFLNAQDKLFYYLRRNQAPSGLITPESKVKFNGQVIILTNKGTGSAAEIFAGFMQAYNKAKVLGDNTAGQVFLKSLFDLPDGAVIELTVGKGYLFNGNPIDFDGLKPDMAAPDTGLIEQATQALVGGA